MHNIIIVFSHFSTQHAAAEALADTVLSLARAEASVAVETAAASASVVCTDTSLMNKQMMALDSDYSTSNELSVVVHTLHDQSTSDINASTVNQSDLATIVESLTLGEQSSRTTTRSGLFNRFK